MKIVYAIAFLGIITSCADETSFDKPETEASETSSNIAVLTELSDEDYPDNPDLIVRHSKYTTSVMESVEFIENGSKFDIVVYPSESGDDTVKLNGIALCICSMFSNINENTTYLQILTNSVLDEQKQIGKQYRKRLRQA